MNQADIEELKQGRSVILKARGDSMAPLIRQGDECLVVPLEDDEPKEGDIVFCRVRGRMHLHFDKDVKDGKFQIGNNKGGINGWVGRMAIFGKLNDTEREKSPS